MADKPGIGERIYRFGVKLAHSRPKATTTARLQLLLLIGAMLALYVAFKYGQEWYVEEFATYDWARDLGF